MHLPKKINLVFTTLLISIALHATEKRYITQIDISSPTSKLKVVPVAPATAEIQNKVERHWQVYAAGSFDEWRTIKFTITPETDSPEIFIILQSPYANRQPFGVFYDNFTVDGKIPPNGDFNKGMLDWGISGTNRLPIKSATVDDSRVNDSPCGLIWREDGRYRKIFGKAGVPISVSVKFKLAGLMTMPSDVRPLDLREFVNRGFVDEMAGDNKGGWSDQGSEKDMSMIYPGRMTYGGMEFKVIDPAKNNGKAAAVFNYPDKPTGLNSFTVPVPEPGLAKDGFAVDTSKGSPPPKKGIFNKLTAKGTTYHYLYLLHSSAWTPSKPGIVLGDITLTFTDGSVKNFTVESGRDLIDWCNSGYIENAFPVFTQTSNGENKHLFISRFAIPDKPVKAIRFEGAGKSVWMLVAASLSSRRIPEPQKKNDHTIVLGKEYSRVDFDNTEVISDSILDVSLKSQAKSCGILGRVFAATDGTLRFTNKPDEPVRFYGNHISAPHDFGKEPDIRKFVQLHRRQGYNALRIIPVEYLRGHYLKKHESPKTTADGFFNQERLKRFDAMIDECGKNGIYVMLGSCASILPFAEMAGVKQAVFSNYGNWREKSAEYTRKLLNHVNQYNGIALKDDPTLMIFEQFNENSPTFLVEKEFSTTPRMRPLVNEVRQHVLKDWQDYLKKRYDTIENIKKLFPKETATCHDFKDLPLPYKYNALTDWAHVFQEFTRSYAIDYVKFFREIMEEVGYKGIITLFNFDQILNLSYVRALTKLPVSINVYHHPINTSSIGSTVRYFRAAASCYNLNSPLIVSEYQDNANSSYVYEAGITFPAYSALQNIPVLFVHRDAVASKGAQHTAPNYLVTYNSPSLRAGQLLGYLLYCRGDVRASSNLVELEFSHKMMETRLTNSYVNTWQDRLSLLCGMRISFETPEPGGAKGGYAADARVKQTYNEKSKLKKSTVQDSEENRATQVTLRIPGMGSDAGGDFQKLYNVAYESKSGDESLRKAVDALREKSVFDEANRTDISKGIYESDTKELFLDSKNLRMSVRTLKTEAIALPEASSANLGFMEVNYTSTGACIAISSMDGKKLKDSSRLLLFYITAEAKNGSILKPNGEFIKEGKEFLLKSGRFNLTLRTANREFICYPLSMNGIRRQSISIKQNDKGELNISVNTAELPNGATTFFEIIDKN